jgi:hypothetical protein
LTGAGGGRGSFVVFAVIVVEDTASGAGGVRGTFLASIVEEAILAPTMGTRSSLSAAVFVSEVGSFGGLESLIEGFFSSAKYLCTRNQVRLLFYTIL